VFFNGTRRIASSAKLASPLSLVSHGKVFSDRYRDNAMAFTITEFESTPNPNAVKIWLDRPISDGPRSFLNAEMAADDPIASALFQRAGITTALFNGNWLSVNKPAEANWSTVKNRVRAVLAEAE
jgi:hypothetical protein